MGTGPTCLLEGVRFVFAKKANELGEFESGITAGWFGTIAATVFGGVGTLVVVALWLRFFPTLRQADRLEDAVE